MARTPDSRDIAISGRPALRVGIGGFEGVGRNIGTYPDKLSGIKLATASLLKLQGETMANTSASIANASNGRVRHFKEVGDARRAAMLGYVRAPVGASLNRVCALHSNALCISHNTMQEASVGSHLSL